MKAEIDSFTAPQNSDLPAGLSAPALRALHGAGCYRLEQVAQFSEEQVRRLHGIGPNALRLLHRALAERGLSFAGRQVGF